MSIKNNSPGSSKVNRAIIRVQKIKSFGHLKAYQMHVNREVETPNADVAKSEDNFIMRGGDNVVERVNDFMKERGLEVTGKGTKNQSVLCTEMLITASPDFFLDENGERDMTKVEKWAFENDKWLKDQYGDNYLFSKVHLDEKSPHISIIIQPTSYHTKYKKEVLSHKKWFGKDKGKGYNKLKDLQRDYPQAMKDAGFDLERGIEKSQAKHQSIQTFYGKVDNVENAVNDAIVSVENSNKSLIEQLHEELEAQKQMASIEINARNEIINKVGQTYDIQDELNEAYPIAKQRAIDKMNGIDVDNNDVGSDIDGDIDGGDALSLM